MKPVFPLLLSAVLLLVAGCRTKDVRTVVISAPGMRCEECAKRVALALSAVEGVDTRTLDFDVEKGTVAVTYDSMVTAIKNLEFAVAGAGYAVEAKPYPLPPDPTAVAALPAPCREHVR
jgi:copper chaperone CopZ